jgi:thioredoxin 1
VFRRVASKHPQHRFAQIDTDAEKELRESLGITHVPSLLVFRDGLLLFKQSGKFDEETLDNIIAQAESLDMRQVRAELAGEADNPGDPSAA